MAVDSTTTNVGVPIASGLNVGNNPPAAVGAIATSAFLQQYVTSVGGRPMSVAGRRSISVPHLVVSPQITVVPKMLSWTRVPNGTVVSGEFAIPVSSSNATIYLLGCTTNCFANYDFPANSDGTHARGQFAAAQFDVQYSYTTAYLFGGGFAFEILNSNGCTPNLVGSDSLAPSPAPSPVLNGDYGVPISIHGTGSAQASQRFGLNPRGGFPFIGASWAQQVIDPGQPAYTPVQPAAYILPAPPGQISSNSYSVSLGYDNYGTGHGFTYILPGGNFAPEWIWDYVATPIP